MVDRALAKLEAGQIRRALLACGGNRTKAARHVNINRQLLYTKGQRHGLSDQPSEITTDPVGKPERSAVFASGMAAIATTLFAFLRPGDTVLHSRPLYGGTETLLGRQMGAFGVAAFGFWRVSLSCSRLAALSRPRR